jgi:tetratricopeptide (TPR) repeat protein
MSGAKSDEVRRLLKRGLNHYGLGDLEAAIACWEHAQRLDPTSRAASDYLQAAREERGDPPAAAVAVAPKPAGAPKPVAAPKPAAAPPAPKAAAKPAPSKPSASKPAPPRAGGSAKSAPRAQDDDATPRTLEGPLGPPPQAADEATDGAVKAALQDYKSGRLDEAWTALTKISQGKPERLDVQGYLVMIRTERAKIWAKAVGDQGRVLRLRRPMAELMREVNLAPDEGYLLSQIDGTLSIEQLLSMSKTERVRSLEILAMFLAKGFVA